MHTFLRRLQKSPWSLVVNVRFWQSVRWLAGTRYLTEPAPMLAERPLLALSAAQ